MRKTGSVKRCLFCNKDFYVPLWKSKIGEGKFCTRACASKGKGPNNGYFQKGHGQLTFKDPSKWVSKICICGKNFDSLIARELKFCGKTCRYKYQKSHGPHSEETKRKIQLAHKRIHAGHPEKAINWKGGVSFVPGYKSLMKKKSWLNTAGSHTKAEWEDLKAQYGFICPACNRSEPEIKLTQDHIVPLTKGGNDYIKNIQPLCRSCNTRKMVKIIKYENTYATA